MEREELEARLRRHALWLNGDPAGERLNLYGADLRRIDLCRADLQRADLGKASLYEANLQNANLWGADLWNADLRSADLRAANLREADLQAANLCSAAAHNADLCGAHLRGAGLCQADLRGANLGGASLRRANLWAANLRGADLCRADLRDAYLQDADLSEAHLYSADLRGANLQGANLAGATGLAKIMGVQPGNYYWKRFGAGLRNAGYQFHVGLNTLRPGEVFASDERQLCSFPGFHFASRSWCAAMYPDRPLEALIRIPEDAQVNEPWATDGKASADKIEIIRVFDTRTGEDVTDQYR